MDDESNPFLTPPVAHQLEKVDDGVFSFRKKKPIAKRIIPQSPIRPPRKSPARPPLKHATEPVERPTASDSVPSQFLVDGSRSIKSATLDRKKGQPQQLLQSHQLQQQNSQSSHQPKRPRAPAIGTENCDLVWKGKFLTYAFPPQVEIAAPSSALKKKIKAKLSNRRAGDGKDDEEDAVKPIVTRIPGVVFALPRENNYSNGSRDSGSTTSRSDIPFPSLSSSENIFEQTPITTTATTTTTSSRRGQIINEGTSMQVVSKIQMSTFPPFMLRPGIKPCQVCPLTKQSRSYFRRLLDEETVLDALARSMSSDDGNALADVGILVKAVAEKTKKSKKKLTLMEAILKQRATLRGGNSNGVGDKEISSSETVSEMDRKQRSIYQKTLMFLVSASVTMNEAGLPSVSYYAHPLLDYDTVTKTILLGSQSFVHTDTSGASGHASKNQEKKPIIDINDLTEHVTKENPTDLDQGLGLLPETSSSPLLDIVAVKKEEVEEEEDGDGTTSVTEDPYIHNLIYGSDGESEDDDMEDMEQLMLNLRESIARDDNRLPFEEPKKLTEVPPSTPKKKSIPVTTTVSAATTKSLSAVVKTSVADPTPVGNSKKRPASASNSAIVTSTVILPLDPSNISKKRKVPVATYSEELSSSSSSSPSTPSAISASQTAAVAPVTAVPLSAMATVLATPKVAPLPVEVSVVPSATVPRTTTTTEHRNKETVKALMNTVLGKINIGLNHDDYEEYSDEILKRVLFSMRKDLTTKLYHLEELERLMDRHAEML